MVMGFISHSDCLLHEMEAGHPEQPARLQVIEDELVRTGLIDHLKLYEAPLAERAELIRAHDANYVDFILGQAPAPHTRIPLDPDTSMGPYTLNAALRAAGAVRMAVDLILQQEINTAFCNIRPPGHHAEQAKAMGFCFFNNVAVGVMHAFARYSLNRIAIVDFDVHHGNGTEAMLGADDRVLFCSSFQSPFYPFSGDNTKNPHIINVPMPAGTAGKAFREHVSQAWFERLAGFKPDMVFFSAGFDAYVNDVMSDLALVPDDYAWLTREIKHIADEVCQGRIVSVLEGGYALQGLGECVAAHIGVLAGR